MTDHDSEPYTAPMIVRLLRQKTDAELAVTDWQRFQMHPTRKIVKGEIIRELIANEKARRAAK